MQNEENAFELGAGDIRLLLAILYMSCYAVNTTDLSFGYSDSVVLDFISRLPPKTMTPTSASKLNNKHVGIIDTKTKETTSRYK